MPPPSSRLGPWMSVAALVLLGGGAATASALTAPAPVPAMGSSAPRDTPPVGGMPCRAPAGSPTLTLTDLVSRPALTVEPGEVMTVMVPPWHWGQASDLTIVRQDVLGERCSVLLGDGGRRAVVVARAAGHSEIGATVTPASDAMMPAWGGEVIVEATPQPATSTTTSTTSVPGTLVLTQPSAGHSYRIGPGQVVQIVLPGTGQPYHGYVTPQSDGAAVQLDGVVCGAPSGDFCTEFVGERSGTARISSTLEPACRQAVPPCEIATMVWWVDLSVG